MRILAAALCLAACGARAESIFPPNDLHLQDNLNATEGITESLFGQIIRAGASAYEGEACQRNEKLLIRERWKDATVNANVMRSAKYNGTVTINMYGGLARRPEITPAGFAIVVCHELGHAYAGAPYVYEPTELSAEGMADWYSTRHCLKRIWERVPELKKLGEYEPFIDQNCVPEDSLCRNGLHGAKGLASLLALLMREDGPRFETPDLTEVEQTVLSYPDTVQCRLDSYRAGVFSELKPRCWYKP